MPQTAGTGKCGVGGGGGGGGGGNPYFMAWDKNLVDAKFLEDLVQNNIITKSATPKVLDRACKDS